MPKCRQASRSCRWESFNDEWPDDVCHKRWSGSERIFALRLKSYFSDTVEAAMNLAARELGEDALLVYSREASSETNYLGKYEVVFAAGQPETVSDRLTSVPEAALMDAAPAVQRGHVTQLVSEQFGSASSALADLRNEIGSLRQDVAAHRRCLEDFVTSADRRAWRLLADWGEEPGLLPGVALAGRLLQADMDPEHVLEVIECVRDSVRAAGGGQEDREGGERWRSPLQRELVDRRVSDATLGQPGRRPAVMLTGPPGSGKTTVAMQLAAHAIGRNLEPRIIAFEPGRLTAAQALRSYAAVLGAPFELARRADHLANLLATRGEDTLTIIDGPGVGPACDDGAAQLAAFSSNPPIGVETWLVLPAALRSSDLRLLVERFGVYRPRRLVFSRTAETNHWGAVWSAAEWSGLPMAFFCNGPRIPEDLKAASSDTLAANLLGGQGARADRRPLAERAGASGRG